MVEYVKPLSTSEELLLTSFCDVLHGRERSDELFEAACEMLEGLHKAFMAARRIRKIKKELADAKETTLRSAADTRGNRGRGPHGRAGKRSSKPRRD
jgi:hypothetical protein